MSEFTVRLNGLQDTRRLAHVLTDGVPLPLVIALSGTLGAGKTQLVRFAAESLGVAADLVTSPTYVLLQHYRGRKSIYHFDFYRLRSPEEVWDLGIDELLEQPALFFVEWAEKFPECLPTDRLSITLAPTADSGEGRSAHLTAAGPSAREVLEKVRCALADHKLAD